MRRSLYFCGLSFATVSAPAGEARASCWFNDLPGDRRAGLGLRVIQQLGRGSQHQAAELRQPYSSPKKTHFKRHQGQIPGFK